MCAGGIPGVFSFKEQQGAQNYIDRKRSMLLVKGTVALVSLGAMSTAQIFGFAAAGLWLGLGGIGGNKSPYRNCDLTGWEKTLAELAELKELEE